MRGREAFAYVVAVEGSKVIFNLKDTYKGQFAAHRDGLNPVTEINGLFGVDMGNKILIMRVSSLSFVEPKEVHRVIYPKANVDLEPLRQLIGLVVGALTRVFGDLVFVPDSLSCPSLGSEAIPLSTAEIDAIFANKESGECPRLVLGKDSKWGRSITVGLSALLGRHVAVLGSTGQGKSCFTAAMVQQILRMPFPRIVLFDINGEYYDAVKDGLRDNQLKITDLGGGEKSFKIPYYALGRHGLGRLLLPSDKAQRPALAFALDNLAYVKYFKSENGVGTAEGGKAVMFDDCRPGNATEANQLIEKMRKGELNSLNKWPHMSSLACIVADSYSLKPASSSCVRDAFLYGHVAPLITMIRRLVDDPLFCDVIDVCGSAEGVEGELSWELEGERIVKEIFGGDKEDWKIHIINLRNVAHDLLPLILGSLLELFSFEIFRRGQGKTYPTMLILEEAHHYLRKLVEGDNNQALAYERLAKEGRKFGIGLWISTQRPSEVSQTVLAQCGTWAVFRLTSESDLKTVGSAGEWVDKIELSRIAGLPRQQALVFGSSVPIPVRIVSPEANPRPHSQDPDFSRWTGSKSTCGDLPSAPGP